MPKTGNAQSGRKPQTKGLFDNVEGDRARRFEEKITEFWEDYEWSRDSFIDDLSDLRNVQETVQEIIDDLQDQIDRIEGNGDYSSEIERHKKEFGKKKLEELQKKGNQKTPYLKEISDEHKSAKELYKKKDEWSQYKAVLRKIGVIKLEGVARTYREEQHESQIANKMLEYIEKKQEFFEEQMESTFESKIDSKLAEFQQRLKVSEQKINELEDDNRRLKSMLKTSIEANNRLLQEASDNSDISKDLERTIRKMQSQSNIVTEQDQEEIEEAVDQSFDVEEEAEKAAKESQESKESVEEGSVEKTEDKGLDEVEEDSEEPDQSEETSQSEDVESFDDLMMEEYIERDMSNDIVEIQLEDRSTEEKYRLLKILDEEEDVEAMDQVEVAEYTDVDRNTLMNEVLKEVYRSHETTFGITDRTYD